MAERKRKQILRFWAVAEQRANSHAITHARTLTQEEFSSVEFFSQSLLVLNRAKGPAGLMRGDQKYIFWGCREGAEVYKIFLKFGVQVSTLRYDT